MQRDMELIRKILLKLEESPISDGLQDVDVDGYTRDQIIYHVRLMDEAGLIEAKDIGTHSGVNWVPKRITYQGHEFIDAARNEQVWRSAKDKLMSTVGTLTVEGLKIALQAVNQSAPPIVTTYSYSSSSSS